MRKRWKRAMLASWAQAGGPSSLLTGLVAYYQMESAAGADATGRGNTLTASASNPTVVAGKVANALNFAAASSQKLSRTSTGADDLTMTGSFTLAAWVNVTTFTSTKGIIAKLGAATEYRLDIPSANTIRFFVQSSANSNGITSQGSLLTGTWYLLVGWLDIVDQSVNLQVNNGGNNRVGYTSLARASDNPFNVGHTGFGSEYFDGIIDEIGIWTRVLTPAERTTLYNGGAGKTYPF